MVKCDNTRKKYILYDYEAEQSTTRSLQFATILIAVLLLAVVVVPHFMDNNMTVKADSGDIGAEIDSYDFGILANATSRNAIVKLGDSNYYATVSAGASDDGYLRTVEIFDNGTITGSLVDEWEFNITRGMVSNILHISDDMYAIAYSASSVSYIGNIFTTTIWDNNGTIKEDKISEKIVYGAYALDFLHLSEDIYVISYQNFSDHIHYLETYSINSATGVISNVLDRVVVNNTVTTQAYEYAPSVVNVDDDTVAVVYSNGSGLAGCLATYDIDSGGDISTGYVDFWVFETGRGSFPDIHHINGNVYALAFNDVSYDGQIKTVSISDSGAITKSFIGSFEFDTDCYYPTIFTVNDASVLDGVYGISYRGIDLDGWIKTINITDDGVIGDGVIDSFEFDDTDNKFYSNVIHLSDNNYSVFYTAANYYGSIVTFDIETEDEPMVSSFSLSGLTDDKVTWYGLRGESVWCNSSGTGHETLQIQMTCNDSLNVTHIDVYLNNLSYDTNYLPASSITMYVSSDNSSFGSLGAFDDGGSNISINSSEWNAGTMGANPFPIEASTSATIYVRFLLAIPSGDDPPDGTYVSTGFKVYIYGNVF